MDHAANLRALAVWLDKGTGRRPDSDDVRAAADQLEADAQRLELAESVLLRRGYRRSCDIPACNCGDQWTHGGHAEERLREISEALGERAQGKTLLQAVEADARRIKELEAANAVLLGGHRAATLATLLRVAERAVLAGMQFRRGIPSHISDEEAYRGSVSYRGFDLRALLDAEVKS